MPRVSQARSAAGLQKLPWSGLFMSWVCVSYITRQIGHAFPYFLLGPSPLEGELDFIRSQVAEAVDRSVPLTVSCQSGDRFSVREQECIRLHAAPVLLAPGEYISSLSHVSPQ